MLFVIKSDRFPEPTMTIIITFVFGALISEIAAGPLNYIVASQLEETAIAAASAGFIEEPLKFLILYLLF